jgi:hypothetical protein
MRTEAKSRARVSREPGREGMLDRQTTAGRESRDIPGSPSIGRCNRGAWPWLGAVEALITLAPAPRSKHEIAAAARHVIDEVGAEHRGSD